MLALRSLLLVLAFGLTAAPRASQEPERQPTLLPFELRTQGEREPLGLDARRARLTWQLAPTDPSLRDLRQAGYRLIVARSLESLLGDVGDLLDTGVLASATQEHTLDLAGLPPFTHLWWKVRVTDQDGADSPWSAPAHLARGPGQVDWLGQWIGHDAPLAARRREPDLEGARWIGAAGAAPEFILRTHFELARLDGLRAGILFAAADEHELFVNGTSIARGALAADAPRAAQLARAGQELVVGTNRIELRVRRTAAAPAAILKVVLEDSEGARSVPSDAQWETAPGADGPWTPARVLTESEIEALGPVQLPSVFLPPPRLLRTDFETPTKPVRATLHASALGLYSLELNGLRVGQDWFAPGWTDYTQRVPYRSYDVTHLVAQGPNAVGAVLADGWYAGFLGKQGRREAYGARTRLLLQLELEYPDGTRQSVTSGPDWRASTGPWLEADLYMGERFDARGVIFNWSNPGFPAEGWVPVDVGREGEFALTAHDGQPIELLTELTPVAITRDPAGRWIFDLGQNIAGVVRLDVEAPAGTNVLLRFGERLDERGALFRKNLGWARAADLYICRGGGREVWTPRFTYHGFRYVEVSGLPAPPTPQTITGLVLTSAIDDAGTFECSDATINQLVELARWTLRANSMDIPTDCPQRGERLGWLGDAQLFAPSALWLADVARLYTKWCRDLAEAQRPDGSFPSIAPAWDIVASGGPGWDEAAALVPAELLARTGERRAADLLAEGAARMLRARSEHGPDWLGAIAAPYGDWNAREATPARVLALAYQVKALQALAELEGGVSAPFTSWQEAHPALAALARQELETPTGEPRHSTQTALALALNLELVPPHLHARFGAALVADLAAQGMTTGFLGTNELFPALSSLGRTDLGLELLRAREFPGYGSLLERGATTLWERMDGWTSEHGVANGGLTSFNHTPFGTYVAWLFEHVAGIRPAAPGFASISFEPEPTRALEWAEARHLSVRGEIALRWEWDGPALLISVLVPPSTDARLRVPGASAERLRESGRPLAEVEGLKGLAQVGEWTLIALGSGQYQFRLDP